MVKFPDDVISKALAQEARDIARKAGALPPLQTAAQAVVKPARKKRIGKGAQQPNETELRYRGSVLAGFADVRYQPITFHMKNGHDYTPDWVVFENGKPVECHEVKGTYSFASEGRARLAFDQAALEFPGLRWFWGKEW